MPEIFLSYSRVDREKAHQVAQGLEAEGLSIWWDKNLRAGQTYDETTEGHLREAKAVVVLWSTTSVKSQWVRTEATLGQRSSALVPAMIEEAERPIMFELVQTADLIGWDGDRTDERWRTFVEDINAAIAAQSAEPEPQLTDADTMEATFWRTIQASQDPKDFQSYLDKYPDGRFGVMARERLAALSAPAGSPPPQPAATARPASATPPPQSSPAQPAERGERRGGVSHVVLIGAGLGAIGGVFGALAMSGVFSGDEGSTRAEVATPSETTETTESADASATTDAAGSEDGISASATFQDCETCPVMTRLEGGVFVMGSPEGEPGRAAYEGPQRDVTVPSFAMSEGEVTFAQWDACLDGGGCRGHRPSDRGFGRGDQPAMSLSWNDAQAYVQWLSVETGRSYRLPTEAEWEYAARAGTETAYWFGAAASSAPDPRGRPHPVSALAANPFGLYAMSGNMREWVQDCYLNTYEGAPTDGSAVTQGDCSRRVIRDGAWSSPASQSRSANRARIGANTRDRTYGFRVATSQVDEG